jgi:hypothetical protein
MLASEMFIEIPLMGAISLRIMEVTGSDYASCRIQKGLLLALGDIDLAEEGTGFGVPVLKFGHEAIFPGSARINSSTDKDKTSFAVDYDLNLAERMAVKGRKINSRTFYRIKELLSSLHREYPCFRKILMHASSTARRAFGIVTRFEKVPSCGIVHVLYTIRSGNIHISVDTSRVKKNNCTGIMLMNEQGANYFDKYCDSSGLSLKGKAIGTWDEAFVDWASFVDASHKLEFTLQKVAGARIFRGRELVPGRLAWSGLAYSIPPDTPNFSYIIRMVCR